MKIGLSVYGGIETMTGEFLFVSSHPEKPFPDENTQLPANVYARNPLLGLGELLLRSMKSTD